MSRPTMPTMDQWCEARDLPAAARLFRMALDHERHFARSVLAECPEDDREHQHLAESVALLDYYQGEMNRCLAIWHEEMTIAVSRITDRIRNDETLDPEQREAVAQAIEAGDYSPLAP